jgi:alpha-D-xyloside xylohydrolase
MRTSHRILWVALIISSLALIPSTRAQWTPLNPVTKIEKQADGLLLTMQTGVMRLQVCSDSIVHVTYSPTPSIPQEPQFMVNKTSWPVAQWTTDSTNDEITLATTRMKVVVIRKNSWTRFTAPDGKKLFEERKLSMTPVVVNGRQTYHSEMFSDLWDST